MDKAASSTPAPARRTVAGQRPPRTLAVDVGGTGIKAELLDERGRPLTDRARIPTPENATPARLTDVVCKLAAMRRGFDRVSVGFPGLIKDGVVYSAPNLGRGWNNFDLQGHLRRVLKRPVRVANDADVQGLGAVSGHGVELVITLGTGFGSVIFVDGHRIHLELGHHPFRKGKTYEDELGHRMLKKKGKARWNRRLREAIDDLKRAFNYDRLFIGGGNTKYMSFDPPDGVKVVSNEEGLLGGIKLWEGANQPAPPKRRAAKPSAPARPTSRRKVVADGPAPSKDARNPPPAEPVESQPANDGASVSESGDSGSAESQAGPPRTSAQKMPI